ncbi:MAG: hypothetical protein RLZZ436_4663, partial [Planctomycetota bacterium]
MRAANARAKRSEPQGGSPRVKYPANTTPTPRAGVRT